jgi:hypothetical protein
MPCTVILLDLPAPAVQLDLTVYSLPLGFRGFQAVTAGLHFLQPLPAQDFAGLWLFLLPHEVWVRRFDRAHKTWSPLSPELAVQYQTWARSGNNRFFLLPVETQQAELWTNLTCHITEVPLLQPAPPEPIPTTTQAFVQLLEHTYEQCYDSFLNEVQFAFLQSRLQADRAASLRWVYLVNSLYHAGVEAIATHAPFFAQALDVLRLQFSQLPAAALAPNTAVTAHCDRFLADLSAAAEPELAPKLAQFQDFWRDLVPQG